MKSTFLKSLVLGLLFLSAFRIPHSAFAADVLVRARDSGLTAKGARTVTLTPASAQRIGDDALIVRETLTGKTDLLGELTFTNVLFGSYNLSISGSPSTTFPIYVPNSNGVWLARDLVAPLLTGTNDVAGYTRAQLDAKLAALPAGTTNGSINTNNSIAFKADVGVDGTLSAANVAIGNVTAVTITIAQPIDVRAGGTGSSNHTENALLVGNGTNRVTTATVGAGLSLAGGVLSASGGITEGYTGYISNLVTLAEMEDAIDNAVIGAGTVTPETVTNISVAAASSKLEAPGGVVSGTLLDIRSGDEPMLRLGPLYQLDEDPSGLIFGWVDPYMYVTNLASGDWWQFGGTDSNSVAKLSDIPAPSTNQPTLFNPELRWNYHPDLSGGSWWHINTNAGGFLTISWGDDFDYFDNLALGIDGSTQFGGAVAAASFTGSGASLTGVAKPADVIGQGAANTNYSLEVSNGLRSLLIANDITTSNGVVALIGSMGGGDVTTAQLITVSNQVQATINSIPINRSIGSVGFTNGDVSIPTNKSLILQNGSKGFEMKNGHWWSGPIPYLRPTATGPLAFDIMPKSADATAYDVWLDICGMDIENSGGNYETLKLYKGAGGDAIIGTTKAGTGTLRALQIQDGNAALKLGSGGGTVNVGSGGGTINFGPASPTQFLEVQPNNSASGDRKGGMTLTSLHTNLTIVGPSGVNKGVGLNYYSGGYVSALEFTNPPSGFGNLKLMKGGGTVSVGGDLTVGTNITANGRFIGNGSGLTNLSISNPSTNISVATASAQTIDLSYDTTLSITNAVGGAVNVWLTNCVDRRTFVLRCVADGSARTLSFTNASGYTLNVISTNGFSVTTLPQFPVSANKIGTVVGRVWISGAVTNVDLFGNLQP